MCAWKKQCVVVPIDFSAKSSDAVATALEFVDDPAHVHVVHAVIPLDNMSPGVVWGTVDDESRVKAVEKHFSEFISENRFAGVTTVIRMGNPGIEITEYAEEVGADLIVIPSHGYHGVRRFLLGSVAERVLRHAHCPVLVLRRYDTDDD